MGIFVNWFRGVRGKLLVQVTSSLVVVAVVAGFGLYGITLLTDKLEQSLQVDAKIYIALGNTDALVSRSNLSLRQAYGIENDVAARQNSLDIAKKSADALVEEYKTLENPKTPGEIKAGIQIVKPDLGVFREQVDIISSMLSKNTRKDDDLAKATMAEKLVPIVNRLNAEFDSLDKIKYENLKKSQERAHEIEQMTFRSMLLAGTVGGISLLLFGIVIAKNLANALSAAAHKLSEGAHVVSSTSQQLTAASQILSSSATEAASSLEETVASTEELSSMVKQNADNAREAAALSQTSRKSAEDGEAEIRRLIEAMSEISTSSKKIEEIINVIDDIAFQTNLLALNAAVEAARAGEQGKGFAVVAEAVRNLAQRSSTAAKDITTLIKDSVHRIEHGSKTADQSGEVLKAIVHSVKKVADLNNEISAASREQATGLSQISKAMNEIDRSTQGNASSSEEVAAASEEMSSQAMSLQEVVDSLVQVVNGNGRANAAQVQKVPTHQSRKHRPMSVPRTQQRTASAQVIAIRNTQASEAESMIPFEGDPSVTAKITGTHGF